MTGKAIVRIFVAAALFLILVGSGWTQIISKIDGLVFSDYYYNFKNSVAAEKDRNGFQYRRIYFTFENNITADLKARFRLESESNSYGSTAKINPFVKHAYLEWANLIPKHLLYLGIAETNGFKNSEELWGYRSIEKTIMDLNKISSSADFGVALKGDFNKYVHHWLTVMNGTGYGAAEGDRYKKVGYALWFTPVKSLILEGYADFEKQNAKDLQTATQMSAAKDYALASQYTTFKGFAGLNLPRLTLGAEVLLRTNTESGIENASSRYDSTAKKYKVNSGYTKADVKRFGYSIFGSWITPIRGLKAFARYDFYDNNTGDDVITAFSETTGKFTNGMDDENTLIIAGLDIIPTSVIHIMPNVMIKNYAKGGKDSDITGRITLYYQFNSGKISIDG